MLANCFIKYQKKIDVKSYKKGFVFLHMEVVIIVLVLIEFYNINRFTYMYISFQEVVFR